MKKVLMAVAVLGAALTALPATASAVPAYYCEASAGRSGLTGEPIVANRPPVRPCEDDVDSLLTSPENPVLSLSVLEAYTNDFPRRPTPTTPTEDPEDPTDPTTNGSVARAQVAGATLLPGAEAPEIPLPFELPETPTLLSAGVLKAQVDTTCESPAVRPENTGSGGVADLEIFGETVPTTGEPNQEIPLPGIGTLWINYENEVGSGTSQADPKLMTRRAVFLDSDPAMPLGALLGDVVISEAISGFEGVQNPCAMPIPAGE